MKIWKTKIHLITEEFFQFSLLTYLILLLLEALQEGFVSFFFDLNSLLCVVLLSGLVMVLTSTEQTKTSITFHKIRVSDIVLLFFLASISGIFIFYKTFMFGLLGIVITVVIVFIIILLSLLLLKEQK